MMIAGSTVALLVIAASCIGDSGNNHTAGKDAGRTETGGAETGDQAESGLPGDTSGSDGDGDGWETRDDCDDADAAVHPNAEEYCDGVDNDCDGVVDPETASGAPEWYADDDGDGFGNAASSVVACAAPRGFVSDATDCDDATADVSPGAAERCGGGDENCDGVIDEVTAIDATSWYSDADVDGFGEDSAFVVSCVAPEGMSAIPGDCDDADASVNPMALEVCGGGDENCDGMVDEDTSSNAAIWYPDADGDGFGDAAAPRTGCAAPLGHVADSSDCDDTDALTNPAMTELCGGGDENCDGMVDEETAADAAVWYADVDGDGFGNVTESRTACTALAGLVAIASDCDDADPAINPAVAEVCGGGDENCDGVVDEDTATGAGIWYADVDGDGFGDAAETQTSCIAPKGYLADATDCDDIDASANPAALEWCGGGDENCDGAVDENAAVDAPTWYADLDSDGFGDAGAAVRSCVAPIGYSSDASDCDDADAMTNSSASELCGGGDENCDGEVDEDTATDALRWYADVDGDGFGDATDVAVSCAAPAGYVSDATDCDDGDPSTNSGSTEFCGGADEDCDGVVDEGDAADSATWYADRDGDGFGDPAVYSIACMAPADFVANATDCDDANVDANPAGTERCGGGDENCDGTVDEDAAADALTWYIDADADGYGNAVSSATACGAPAGYVADATDCDDADGSANPGASEHCGGGDEDCDGAVDEDSAADAQIWSVDADGDGYGDETAGAASCLAPAGTVSPSTDCDDADAAVSPAATEICENHIDDDCDDSAGACAFDGGWITSADAVLNGETRGDYSGAFLAGGDLDADGYGDVLVGSARAAGGTGLVQVARGPFSGTSNLSAASYRFTSTSSRNTWLSAAIGDFDGSGIGDVALGNDRCTVTGQGAVYIFADPSPGTMTAADADTTWCGESADRAGSVIASVADQDGDGITDILVNAEFKAYVFSGTSLGTLNAGANASATITEAVPGAVADAGDLDGDGANDLVLGMGTCYWYGTTGHNEGVFVLPGPVTGAVSASTAAYFLSGEGGGCASDAGDEVFGPGDVNEDGYDDLLVTAPTTSAIGGSFYIVLGPITADASLADAHARVTPSFSGTDDGIDEISAGDIDGDGHPEVVVTMSDIQGYGPPLSPYFGDVAIYLETPAGTVAGSADVEIRDIDYWTHVVMASEDLNDDGFSDVVVGGEYGGATGSEGAAYIFNGTGI